MRTQKSASVFVPGAWGKYFQAKDPKIAARRVNVETMIMRSGSS
jgi:hypothetical protein